MGLSIKLYCSKAIYCWEEKQEAYNSIAATHDKDDAKRFNNFRIYFLIKTYIICWCRFLLISINICVRNDAVALRGVILRHILATLSLCFVYSVRTWYKTPTSRIENWFLR